MNPLTFTCSACGKPIGAASDYAGMPVTCPHCGKVEAPVKEREDSIFSEPEDDDNESLFDHVTDKMHSRVEMPKLAVAISKGATPHDQAQPTQRLPGVAAVPRAQTLARPVQALPVSVPGSQSFTASMSHESTSSHGGDDLRNPFIMEAALPTEFSPPAAERDVPSAKRSKKLSPAEAAPNWKLWIIVGLAAYSFLMTILALWGWMRTPHAPVKHDAAPATQKAKTR